MQPKRRARRTSDEIRTRLLDAARELFAEKGYEATTTRDICARSGVAQTQLFHNFGGKEGTSRRFPRPADRGGRSLHRRVGPHPPGLDARTTGVNPAQRPVRYASENRSILPSAVCRGCAVEAAARLQGPISDHIARTTPHEMEVIISPAGIDIPSAIVVTAGMVFRRPLLLQDMLFPSGTPPFSRGATDHRDDPDDHPRRCTGPGPPIQPKAETGLVRPQHFPW
jgi:hypothetical protein